MGRRIKSAAWLKLPAFVLLIFLPAGCENSVFRSLLENLVEGVTAGITVNPTSGLLTTEDGVADTFTVVLDSQPTDKVIIEITSGDPTEGGVMPMILPLTFTSDNWNIPQTVTVTGEDDAEADGDQTYTIITAAADSIDFNYNGINPSDVAVTNIDNDS